MLVNNRPKLAVFKFASCDGCQLSVLDCEDELLTLADRIQIATFLEASRAEFPGPYDITLVEGSITTPHDAARIQHIREVSKIVVTIGACATSGGIQALRNLNNVEDYLRIVYAHPEYIDTLETSTPIADHIQVDFELRGCPIDKHQLLEVLTAFIQQRPPRLSTHSVCIECKRQDLTCVMVARQTPCLGPVTHAGCTALCPQYHRGCFGCFGPADTTQPATLSDRLVHLGLHKQAVGRLYRTFNAHAPEFAQEGARHD